MTTLGRTTVGLGMGAVALIAASPAHAQTLTSRFSQQNYQSTYGGGGDVWSPTDSVTNGALLAADDESFAMSDTRNGFIVNDPNRPWGASVGFQAVHGYQVTGPLASFSRIRASGSTTLTATSSGEGVALMISANPGNTLELYFSLTSASLARLSGEVSLNPDGQNLAAQVTLQRFDGIVWQNVFNSLFLSGQEGVFDNDYDLTPGSYRIVGLSAGNAFHQTRTHLTNGWSYDLQIVPEPATVLALGTGVLALIRRRRRA